MKISCAQITQAFGSPSAAFEAAESFIAASDADMIMFPEQYATGWRAEGFSDVDGAAVKERWLSLAKTYQKCIVGSYPRKMSAEACADEVCADSCGASEGSVRPDGSAVSEGSAGSAAKGSEGSDSCALSEVSLCPEASEHSGCSDTSLLPENCMLVCSPSGEVLAEYAKIHLFSPAGEDKHHSPGTEPVTFAFGGVTFGCAVCFDLRFPELFREYLHAGCQCVLVQAAWPAARIADWELLLRARALENRCYVVGCNCIGYDEVSGTDYCGRSMVCDWEGKVIEDAGVFEGGCEWGMDAGDVVSCVAEKRTMWCLNR